VPELWTLGSIARFMTKKYIVLSIVAAVAGAFVTGCYSTHTSAFLGGYKIKVVDASTKRPIVGAKVELYDSAGHSMGQGTDDQGNMRVASGLLTIGVPKYDRIEVVRGGYESVAFPLTNGLPHQIELTAIQNHK
jgi:hypothetical protein